MVIEMEKQMKWFILVQDKFCTIRRHNLNGHARLLVDQNNRDLEQVDTLEQDFEN